jgi:hypothetical protein
MPFDREAAKTAGYSEAEINAYLAQNPDTTSASQPRSSGDQMLNAIPPLAIGAGLTLADVVGQAASRAKTPGALSRALPELLKLAGKQIPGVHTINDVKQFVSNVAGGSQVPPPIAAAAEATATPGVSRSTRIEVTTALKKRFPALKHFEPGETISAAQLDKIKLAKAGVPTRPITVIEGGKAKPAAAPAQTTEPRYTGGRGASGPELARRAEAMAASSQGRAGQGLALVPPELPPASSLEEQLARSVALEQAMGAKGIPPGLGRVPLRAGVRGMTGNPELDMLMFILSSQNMPEQIDQAQHVLQESRRGQISPALFRALYGNGPQGS